jgi:thymidylate synthase
MHATCGSKKDIPCTLSVQFVLRQERLYAITTMRSNDLWLGFPYDVFCFSTLQRLFAYTLGVDVADYVHNVGSMHLYTRDERKPGPAAGDDMTPHGCREYTTYKLPGRDTRERYVALSHQVNAAVDAERGYRESGWKKLGIAQLEKSIPCPALRDLVVLCASKSVTIDPEWIVSPALRMCYQNVDPRRS